jgi:hypothetical protein
MADMFRRSHGRVPLDRPAVVFMGASAGRRVGEARVVDASLDGAYLSFPGALQRGVPYRLLIDGVDGPLELPFRVAREGPRGGLKAPDLRHYGVNFNLTTDQERELRRLLDALRRPPPKA